MNNIKRYNDQDYLKIGKRAIAVRRLNQAIQNGTMIRPDKCEICYKSTSKIVAHHWNGYDKWFDVWWVCYSCNNHLKDHSGKLTRIDARKELLKDITERMNNENSYTGNYYRYCGFCGVQMRALMMKVLLNTYDEQIIMCQHCYDDIT